MSDGKLPFSPIDAILRSWKLAQLSNGAELEYMAFGSADAQPLVMLHSVEYATMPPWQFCLDAKNSGFRVIMVRRPGFGRSTACARYDDQIDVISEFIEQFGLQDIHLHATGTAGLLGYALVATHSAISTATFCNYAYGTITGAELERVGKDQIAPIKQAVNSKLGCRLLLAGLRASKSLVGSQSVGRQFFCRNEADTHFFKSHRPEMSDSAETLMQISANTLHQDLNSLFVEAAQQYGRTDTPFATLIGGDAMEKFAQIAFERSTHLGGRNFLTEDYDYFVGLTRFLDTLERDPAQTPIASR